MTIPAEHVKWLRKSVKEELTGEAEGLPNGDEISREEAVEATEKVARHIALLDQLGWSDDDAGLKEITLDAEFGEALLREWIRSLGEDMLVATGHYDGTDLDLAEVQLVGARAAWLVSTSEAFGAEAVKA